MTSLDPSVLESLLEKLFKKAKKQQLGYQIALSLTLFVFLLSLYVYAESLFYLSSLVKTSFLLGSLLLVVILWVTLALGKSTWLNRLVYPNHRIQLRSFEAFYRYLGDASELPELKYMLDLQRETEFETDLKQGALVQLLSVIEQKKGLDRVKAILSMNPLVKYSFRLFLVIAALLVSTLIPLRFSDSVWERSSFFWITFERPNPFNYTILPESFLVEQGQFQQFGITFYGEKPKLINFEFKTSIEREFRSFPVTEDSSGYITELIQLNSSGQFRFKMDAFYSDTYTFEVQTLPRFDSLLIAVTPPRYTREKSFERKYPQSSVDFPEGSEIEFKGWANKPVSSISGNSQILGEFPLHSSDSNSTSWSAKITGKQTDTLTFRLEDSFNLSNSNPYPVYLQPIKDNPPSVLLLRPNPITSVTTQTSVELVFEVADDYGLSSTQLEWTISRLFSEKAEKGSLKLPEPRKTGLRTYVWDFSPLNLQPQEEIKYKIVVWDNDAVNWPKRAESAEFVILIPSLTDQFLGEQVQEEAIENTLSDMKNTMDKASQEYKEFLEKMAENPRQNLDNQRKLDQVKQEQEELKKVAEELTQKFEELRKELETNNQLSEETQKAYNELQRLAEELKNDEFMKALEELQRSLNNFDQRFIQEAMQQVKFDEQKYRERIARTMELFKQVKLSADAERLQKTLQELAKQQEQLAADSSSTTQEKAMKQEQLNKETEKAEKLAEELSKNPPEKLKQEVNRLTEELKQELSEAQDAMQDATEQLQQEKNDQAKSKQQKAKENLEKATSMTAAFKKKMGQQQQSIDKQALEQVLEQLILLSTTEEQILLKTNDLDQKSSGFVQQARGQQIINQVFSIISDTLYRVASVNPSLSSSVLDKKNETQRELERSLHFLTERDKISSVTQIRTSMGGINELASMIVTILEQADNNSDGEGGGGGMSPEQMMQQMKDMSGQQQQLNQQMQDMINDMQGNRLNQEKMDRLEQLSKMQQSILKQLEELKKNGEFGQGDKTLSELKRIAEEMEDAINDMRGGRTDRIMIKRQQNILSRMLQAEKAMEEREEDEKRKGNQPKQDVISTPPPVSLEELKKRIMMQLKNGELTPYSKDYQQLIELYFKELEKRIN